MTRFHARTLDLLPVRPGRSKKAVGLLDRVEARIARPLPASVREWYSYEGACLILETHSNQDPPVPLKDLGSPQACWTADGRDLASEGLLLFQHENQGVCAWALRLGDGDDPPVVVSYDDELRNWEHCADSFSDFVFASVWDHTFVFFPYLLIQAQNRPLSEDALRVLRGLFDSEVTTHGWPTHTIYRFHRDGRYLIVWAGDDQADWWLTADTEEFLESTMLRLWGLDRVGDAFWSHTDRGQAMVDRLRSEKR